MLTPIQEIVQTAAYTAANPDTSEVGATVIEKISPDSWVFIAIFSIVGLWLIGISVLFIKLLKKYPFGKQWTEKNPNPYKNETFAMPRGIFRGILTLSLLFIVMLLEVVNLQMLGLEQKIDQLLVAFQMMLAFYFGSKVMHHVTSADRDKEKARSQETQTDS